MAAEPDLIAWARVANSDDPAELRRFIATFPQSRYVPQAKRLIELLQIASGKAGQDKVRTTEEIAREAAREDDERRQRLLTEQRLRDREAEQQRASGQPPRPGETVGAQQAADEKKAALERERLEKEQQAKKLSAVQPNLPTAGPSGATPSSVTLALGIQAELKRVGCFMSTPKAGWTDEARMAVSAFNKAAKVSLATDQPTDGALWLLKQWRPIQCGVTCPSGTVASEGACVAVRKKPLVRSRVEDPEPRSEPRIASRPKAEPKPEPKAKAEPNSETKLCKVTRFSGDSFVCAD